MSEAAGTPAVRVAHVEVPRTARYHALGAADAREVWVGIHGYGQLAGHFVKHLAPLVEGQDRLVVAPEALSRFYLAGDGSHAAARVGATWMTREDREAEIADYVGWLDRALDDATGGATAGAFDAARARLTVLGFSQGAVTACRWLLHRRRAGRAPAHRLILWGGALPHDLDLAADGALLRETPLVLVVGDADEYATPAVVAEQEARLRAAGVAYELVRYAGGHRLDADVLRSLAG